MKFLDELKRIWWDITGSRYLHWQSFYSLIPSYIGQRLRLRFYRKWLKSMGQNCKFHDHVYIRNPNKFSMGNRCHIGYGARIQAGGGLTFGDGVLLGPGVSIWTSNHRFDDPDVPITDQGQEFKEVTIESDVWLGANSFIMPGTHLGRGSVVSAGAVVGGKRYKDFSILAGNPARVIGYRGARSNQPEPSA
jgi:acetyltransferase-like isoleucine patch superfamily enzyme